MNSTKVVIVACLLACLVAVALASKTSWGSYKRSYEKKYSSALDEIKRRTIFELNKAQVDEFNSQHAERLGYKKGINHLSDWTEEEKQMLNGFRPDLYKVAPGLVQDNFTLLSAEASAPENVDWRRVPGRVSEVKDQGLCASCWAFSATGALEGSELLAHKKNLTSLSEQNLVDCSKENYGCRGGLPSLAFSFVHQENGLDDEKSYPYIGLDGQCKFNRQDVAINDIGYVELESGNEELLKRVVAAKGPVSVGIHATENFRHYQSGVFYDNTCYSDRGYLNHGVLVVGYGSDPKHGDYWIVKNSWGSSWGDNGYILMKRNSANQCGIATLATLPVPI